jgi:hypothetical protein
MSILRDQVVFTIGSGASLHPAGMYQKRSKNFMMPGAVLHQSRKSYYFQLLGWTVSQALIVMETIGKTVR